MCFSWGAPARLRELAGGAPHAEIIDAPDVIGSGDEPARAVRDKPQSSLVVAARLVAEGRADAFYSAGNTGACLAAGLLTVRRLQGVLRPAICVLLPAAAAAHGAAGRRRQRRGAPAHLRHRTESVEIERDAQTNSPLKTQKRHPKGRRRGLRGTSKKWKPSSTFPYAASRSASR